MSLFLKNVSHLELEMFDPTLDPVYATVLAIFQAAIRIYAILTHWSIFKLLDRKKGRAINKMLYFQQACMMITSSYTLYGATAMFVYPMGKLVGDFGCYFFDGLVTYYVGLISTNSFYVTLFRYLCIVHHTNSNGIISFEHLIYLLMAVQFSVPLLSFISIRLLREPSPQNGIAFLNCLGQYEMSYGQDISSLHCGEFPRWSSKWLFCQLTLGTLIVTGSNILEMYMLWKCMKSTKSSTQGVKDLLSLTAYERRRREEGVMFAVTFWQWVLEVVFMLLVLIYPQIPRESNKLVDHIFFLFVQLYFALVNTFYLFGDNVFQRSVVEVGVLKALKRALLQNY